MLTNPHLKLTNFHDMLTTSSSMKQFFEQLKRVAPTDASVLIRGDSGTGKELAARAIHTLSTREDAPFRAINCATLTSQLLASELFGHVKGAFTGAISSREGLFRLADGGSIFLDELAEMPLEVQARVLRVLQSQHFVPLGASHPIQVDVRIISATLQSLREGVRQRTFREDLMYRVRVVPLFMPRLVDRDRDIEALMWHFITELNARPTMRNVNRVSEAAMAAMYDYHWPGNVRELRNVVEYAVILGDGDAIELSDLTPEIRGEEPITTRQTWASMERQRILDALAQSDGNRTKAAQALGVSRSTLWRKMKTLRLDK